MIVACLEWIDAYGDLDGDGFQEYQTYSSCGYENMGWKDTKDAVVFACLSRKDVEDFPALYPPGANIPQELQQRGHVQGKVVLRVA